MVHEISRACRRGKLRECLECNKNPDFVEGNDGFQWAGCGTHVNYGTDVAETFVDSLEVGRDARAKINLHNNRVGRRVSGTTSFYVKTCLIFQLHNIDLVEFWQRIQTLGLLRTSCMRCTRKSTLTEKKKKSNQKKKCNQYSSFCALATSR